MALDWTGYMACAQTNHISFQRTYNLPDDKAIIKVDPSNMTFYSMYFKLVTVFSAFPCGTVEEHTVDVICFFGHAWQ
jgi:hypothetical protein